MSSVHSQSMTSPVQSDSSAADPIPTFVQKQTIDLLSPFVADLYRSLAAGHFPGRFKDAFITPIVKKAGFDPTEACSYRPISNLPVLSKLLERLVARHWLRVPERIYFKLAVMTYRSIQGTSPSYVQSCFTRVSGMTSRRKMRFSTSHRLAVRLSTVGRRAFPISGATVWNDLPLHVASAPSLAVFIQRLKTFLFSRSYQDTIV